jgi:dienelactone hydrolase
MTMRVLLLLLMAVQAGPALAQGSVSAQAPSGGDAAPALRWIEHEFMMPAPGAPFGIDVLQVEVERPGRHPLAILTHGTSDVPEERATVTPWGFLPQAIWFARRGYVAIVVVRKGYGRSSGEQDGREGGCRPGGSFEDAGEASAEDLMAVVKFASTLPEVDAGTVVSAGVSTGGFAQVALTAKPPAGLKAAISFAGGRGGDGKGDNCNLDGVVSAFHGFGKKSRVPMLWIYSENDHWFPPAMAQSFDAAFKKGGGNDELVMAPPYGDDGHKFFYNVEGWTPMVEGFLGQQGLLPLTELLPEPSVPDVMPPAGLSEGGVRAFHTFLQMGPGKAFASNGGTHWGMAFGQWSQEMADAKALANCEKGAKGEGVCVIRSRGK